MTRLPPEITIVPAAPEHIPAVRALLEEYAEWLGPGHYCAQNFGGELDGLPGDYEAPGGALLIALVNDQPMGCVALRRLDPETCEMKRLYLRPALRGSGAGRRLAEAIIGEARRIGYLRMRLDTIPAQMGSAVRIYESLGFRDIPPYPANPLPDARFMEINLK